MHYLNGLQPILDFVPEFYYFKSHYITLPWDLLLSEIAYERYLKYITNCQN